MTANNAMNMKINARQAARKQAKDESDSDF